MDNALESACRNCGSTILISGVTEQVHVMLLVDQLEKKATQALEARRFLNKEVEQLERLPWLIRLYNQYCQNNPFADLHQRQLQSSTDFARMSIRIRLLDLLLEKGHLNFYEDLFEICFEAINDQLLTSAHSIMFECWREVWQETNALHISQKLEDSSIAL